MRYKYEVKRIKRTQEELDFYKNLYGDDKDEYGDLIFNLNDPDTLYKAPSVDMVCCKCGYEEAVSHHILIDLNYGNKSLQACPQCSHTKKQGVMYPKTIIDLDGNPITYQGVLNSQKNKYMHH